MSQSLERKLPEELLDRIVSFTTRKSLLNLCLASKTLNRLATPYLYSNICLRETDHLSALAALLITSPIHAVLVKSLTIPENWAEGQEEPAEKSWSTQDLAVHSVLKAKYAEYAPDDSTAHEMCEKIDSGTNEDAIVALLIPNLPELRRLDINFGILRVHTNFGTMWPTIVQSIRTINNSRLVPIDIMVTGAEDKYFNFSFHLAHFFHLPNVRSIYGWKLGDDESAPDLDMSTFARLKPLSCPVEYIELRSSKLHADNFQNLIASTIPGRLKTFSYEIGCTWAWFIMEHPRIMNSLQSHHQTLEALCLSHEDYYPYDADNEFDKPYPCSFVPFVALKRLKVAPVYIWGHEGFTDKTKLQDPVTKEQLWKALPANLEELWITRAYHQEYQEFQSNDVGITFVPDCLLPSLELVLQNKLQSFGNLKHLRIELPLFKWEDEWFDALESLCRTAAANGIQSTIILSDMLDRNTALTVERLWGWNEDIEWEPVANWQNKECAKIWIATTEHQDLAQVLKDLKSRFLKFTKSFNDARNEIQKMGQLCSDCRRDPEYRAHMRVNVAQLERYIDERLHTKTGWKGRDRDD
ncbi:hypothetical protein CC86DRAFT_351829 [Ophiobolus disseminans]|uniref:F-box domain-containing protein n=1 Tax=Ophiobolus disseminans TaxID=1469910 RepID=A0A6A6ZY91_9PLEO|nr:hypothetical protein CC86DRAFT_351829 [Ophiobolus disseminans]